MVLDIIIKLSSHQKKTEKRRSGTQSEQAALNDMMRGAVMPSHSIVYFHPPCYVDAKKREPTENKTPNYYSDGLGSFSLHFKFSDLLRKIFFNKTNEI